MFLKHIGNVSTGDKIFAIRIYKELIYFGGKSRVVRIYDLNKKDTRVIGKHKKTVRCITVCSNLVFTGGYDGTCMIYNEGVLQDIIEGPDTELKGLAYNDSTRELSISTRGKTNWILSISRTYEAEVDSVIEDHTQDVKGCVYFRNFLLTFSYDCTIKVYKRDYGRYELHQNITACDSTVWDLVFIHKYETIMIACCENGKLYKFVLEDELFNISSSKHMSISPIRSVVALGDCVCFIHNTRGLCIVDADLCYKYHISGISNTKLTGISYCNVSNLIVTADVEGYVYVYFAEISCMT